MTRETQVVRDMTARTITVIREFDAPLELVWRAYTEAELLDQWWGPKPWHVETTVMDFRQGGYWLYAMVGPDGQRHYGRMNFTAVDVQKSFDAEVGFCDEHGIMNPAFPVSKGRTVFVHANGITRVEWSKFYQTEADLMNVVNMGFEEGIRVCIEQLVELLPRI